ncbi:TetR/AcrR family transcriptional regulator [Micromonospora sp. U21]|jgi:AcrR family transcriptional regulator|uniref:TetR/AcrR family transcriptional regulator n=1 Tax=Micromonospora sp. U21 TaxID=2824899 RepID=UPI001B36E7D0|nr:TetR/AcrR family transcriptional regulator [Micromonospora sp. U21]MBQ0902728.1 TetR/AcrR family transcriptional regulator [Micromonospora sp. U21]
MPSITRRRPRNPDGRAAVEARVLAATERLLQEGVRFTDLGVQRIAAEAGVARSTFYIHFRDKSELLMRLAGSMRETSFDRVREWDPAGPGDPLEALTEVFTDVIRIYRTYAPVLAAITEVAAYDAAVREYWAAGFEQFMARTEEALRAEQRAGRTPANLDPPAATRLIVLGGDRFLAHHVALTPADPEADAAAARELAATWWYGAYRRPA